MSTEVRVYVSSPKFVTRTRFGAFSGQGNVVGATCVTGQIHSSFSSRIANYRREKIMSRHTFNISLPSMFRLNSWNPAFGKMHPCWTIMIALITPRMPLAPSKCLYKYTLSQKRYLNPREGLPNPKFDFTDPI